MGKKTPFYRRGKNPTVIPIHNSQRAILSLKGVVLPLAPSVLPLGPALLPLGPRTMPKGEGTERRAVERH